MITHDDLLARYCAHRTVDNRNAVISAHRYLCARGARKFARAGSDRHDLEQVAAVGLIKAADNYRTNAETPFQAYAWVMVVGELMHYVRDHERLVRIPRGLRSLERRYAAAWDTFCADHQREPSRREMAADLGTSLAIIDELRSMRRPDRVPLHEVTDGDEPIRWELLADRVSSPTADERITLTTALDALEERERAIVVGTFASGFTQTELAGRLGLSQSRVSKLLARSLSRLGECVA